VRRTGGVWIEVWRIGIRVDGQRKSMRSGQLASRQ